jgi:ABC-type polar amino acid transport system ATPase subunit
MLKQITIENYRSCLRTVIDLHPHLSVLIGPNSSGKTNILQAIMFLKKIALEDPFDTRHDGLITTNSRIKAQFRHRGVEIELRASIDAYTDESNNDVMAGSKQGWIFKKKGVKKESLGGPIAFFMQPNFGSRIRHYSVAAFLQRAYGKSLAKIAGIRNWWQPLSAVARFCQGIKYYSASQFTNPGSAPASLQIEREEKRSRLFRPRGHAKILYDMYIASKASNHEYERFIDIVGPKGLKLIDGLTFKEVPTSSMDYSVRVGGRIEVRKRNRLLVVPQFSIRRQKLSPNQLSDGTFRTLALLFHIITEDSTLLLIEEPEVCIHHGLLSSVLELIKSYSQHKQMILSTHSDYVLDHVTPDNVFRVSSERSKGTVVNHITKSMTSKEYSALRNYLEREGNLGEYWREGGLGDLV